MAWFKRSPDDARRKEEARAAQAEAGVRAIAWEKALARNTLPPFVEERLKAAGEGKVPWISTMTAAELLISKTHGIRPIATVSGTCWYQYGYSWTRGHVAGWQAALDRIRAEAIACGANAVVDVKMRTARGGGAGSMDYTLLGTAVRVEGLPPSPQPVIATVPALEFVRLLEMDIVPTGLAVGAHYEWLTDYGGAYSGTWTWGNTQLTSLSQFWEHVRRIAHAELRRDAASQGNGVLARTQFGQLIKQEGGDKQPTQYLGRHIVVGTVVDVLPKAPVPHGIHTVVDMRDAASPLARSNTDRADRSFNESEGAI